jgi:hypothetical protein
MSVVELRGTGREASHGLGRIQCLWDPARSVLRHHQPAARRREVSAHADSNGRALQPDPR